MYISDLIEDFLEHLEVEGGRSKRTAENYRLYLERFLEIAQEVLNKDDIKPGPCKLTVCSDYIVGVKYED